MRGDRPPSFYFSPSLGKFTPHARGSTELGLQTISKADVYPACAGIDLRQGFQNGGQCRLPRMRGDRPSREMEFPETLEFTPHARGSTLRTLADYQNALVYPACAGIDPVAGGFRGNRPSLPRMRGDRPRRTLLVARKGGFTPHARGSTLSLILIGNSRSVYPACAGIDPDPSVKPPFYVCLPRMRGDRPFSSYIFSNPCVFTPHARGSTSNPLPTRPPCSVYPACAGIDPSSE